MPVDRFQGERQRPLPPGVAAAQARLEVPQVSVAHPVPAEWVVGYEILPRHVEFTAAAGILGLDLDELGRRVDAGEVIPCRPPLEQFGHDWYWHLDEFLTLPEKLSRPVDEVFAPSSAWPNLGQVHGHLHSEPVADAGELTRYPVEQSGDLGVLGEDRCCEYGDPAGGGGGDQVRHKPPPNPAALPGVLHEHPEFARLPAAVADEGGQRDQCVGTVVYRNNAGGGVGSHRIEVGGREVGYRSMEARQTGR